MRILTRKIVVFAVAAMLAVAGGFTPRHAQAGLHAHAAPVMTGKTYHHQDGQTAHHHGEKVEHAAAQAPCHNDNQGTQPNSPLHNCCVTSCSVAAFIFASVSFNKPLPNADYVAFPPTQPTRAPLTSADPPPR
ncbi:MAG: hypothetical protein RO009_15155 [Pseudorhodoplanes sp.]|jgi:hypothetical protein|nr:hypothetical protein [Pseudorhodoplanes sp.]